MNCSNCHMPLEENARFCRNCGTPVAQSVQQQPPGPYSPNQLDNAPTIPTMPWQPQLPQQNIPPQYSQPAQGYQGGMPSQPGTYPQPPVYQPGTFQQGPSSQPGMFQQGPPSQPGAFQQQGPQLQPGTFQQEVVPPQQRTMQNSELQNPAAADVIAPKRRRRHGCLTGFLITLLILVVLVAGGWFLGVRPYLHNIAATQISNVLANGITQIPSQVSQVPANTTFSVTENTLNNLITLETAPSDPVQHMLVSIAPGGMTINFQVYGFGCTVTGVPATDNGHLVVTNVNIQGLASLIMSSDELTTLLNQKLADAQARLNHPIMGVQLKNQELDLLLGPPGSV